MLKQSSLESAHSIGKAIAIRDSSTKQDGGDMAWFTEKDAQREANKANKTVWYPTGDGGGYWVHPDPKAVKRNAARRARNQAYRSSGAMRAFQKPSKH